VIAIGAAYANPASVAWIILLFACSIFDQSLEESSSIADNPIFLTYVFKLVQSRK
jgi:hypothetical protein